jgi:sugar (pentulose or hexulose) kinase
MNTEIPIVLGIDVGTSGVRCVVATANGDVLAEAREPLFDLPASGLAHEQDPGIWWGAVCRTLQALRQTMGPRQAWERIAGLAVTSTSGSLVLTDPLGEPVRAAMLYDDGRAGSVAGELNRLLPAGQAPIDASYSLAKALWVRQQEPSVWKRATNILHPSDWLIGRLTGRFGVCDYSNALKLGYDPESAEWTPTVGFAGIAASMFPKVVPPGADVGAVSSRARDETGLPRGLRVLAGASDGLASFVGSGARKPGDANTTLGTTLVWKVLTPTKPQLRPGMYCHYLPDGLWVPGAASNTGPGSIRSDATGITPSQMDERAAPHFPISIQTYTLGSRGERFPFLNPAARSFFEGCAVTSDQRHAAQLQSLACIERWGYERLEECGVAVGQQIFSAGSAAGSPVLSQLRANVLNRDVVRSAHPTASFGAAILAARTVVFDGDLTAAIRSMTRIVESHPPVHELVPKFEGAYQLFRAACARHGFK